MCFPYSGDGGGSRVLSLIRSKFSENRLFAKPDRHIVFVCGGDKSQANLRSRFLDYAKQALPHVRVLLAEDAYLDLSSGSRRQFINLAVFEDLLADIADCVVLFPESPGSFAELGFFAAKERIASKVLTVNLNKFQADESFVNLGPIAILNDESNYRPTLHVDEASPDFEFIRKRLARFNATNRRMAFPYGNFVDYQRIQRFFAIFETIQLLRVVHTATLPYAIEAIFGGLVKPDEVRHLVAILVAAGYVMRGGMDQRYLTASSEAREFLELPFRSELLAESNLYLLKNYKELYAETLG